MKHRIKLGIKYLCYGISWGCTALVFTCLTAYAMGQQAYLDAITKDFARHAAGAMIVGIACGSTSVIYLSERFSTMVKFMIHFGIGMGVFYLVAPYLGWIPSHNGRILFTLLQFLFSCGIFMGIWLCFYLFNHSDAQKINNRLRELEQENEDNTD